MGAPRDMATWNAGRLEAFLRGELPGLTGPMEVQPILGGQSNPTYFVSFDNRRLVVRKQPAGDILPSAHAVDREFRVMSALAGSDVPVPACLLFHGERDVIGTPFYVMEQLDGRVFHDSALPEMAPEERRAIYLAMAETLARLHRVDYAAVGLADLGRPDGYFERQIHRWTRQWQLSRTRDIPAIQRLIAWLPEHIVDHGETAIVHGDYRLGNLMFHPSEPRVVGVLDWELTTLGHPLADVGYNCLIYHAAPDEFGGIAGLNLDALGIPSEEEYVRHYLEASGLEHGPEVFHLAFSMFRFAVILEGIAARAASGIAAAPDAAEVGRLSAAYARTAVALIERGRVE